MNVKFGFLVGFSMLAAGSARAEATYAKLAGMQIAFDAIPPAQRDKIGLVERVSHREAADHGAIHMWVMQAGQRVDIPVAADGALTLPPHQDWVDQGLIVHSDQKPGSLNVRVEMFIRKPGTAVIPVAYLQDAVEQSKAAIRIGARQVAGFLGSLMAPSVTGVTFTLAGCCANTVTLHSTSGDHVFTQSAKGELDILNASLDADPAATASASAPILKIEPAAH